MIIPAQSWANSSLFFMVLKCGLVTSPHDLILVAGELQEAPGTGLKVNPGIDVLEAPGVSRQALNNVPERLAIALFGPGEGAAPRNFRLRELPMLRQKSLEFFECPVGQHDAVNGLGNGSFLRCRAAVDVRLQSWHGLKVKP